MGQGLGWPWHICCPSSAHVSAGLLVPAGMPWWGSNPAFLLGISLIKPALITAPNLAFLSAVTYLTFAKQNRMKLV